MKTEGAACIDCHQNLVHEEVAKTDLDASIAAGKMVLQKEEDGGDEEEESEDEDESSESGSEAVGEAQSEDSDEDEDEE